MRVRTLENRVFMGLVIATTLLFLWMVRAFLMPVFWAAVLAVLFRPLCERLAAAARGRRTAAALLSTVTVVLVVVIPAMLIIAAVANQALRLYQRIASGEVNVQGVVEYMQRALPLLTDVLVRYGVSLEQLRTGLESAAIGVTQYIATLAIGLGQDALRVTVMFALMLYFLFFFLRDGQRIIAGVVRAVPMGDAREERLLRKFADVARATVKGTLVVAAVQGFLGGVLFAIVGIEAAVFWGVVMGVLSLLPALGPALVWLPAAVILLLTDAAWKALVVVLGGALVVGVVDNVLRPMLIGRQSEMPDYLVLLATLGGLSVFGLAGFVAGPVIAALFLVIWAMFAEEYETADSPRAAGAPAVVAPVPVLPAAPPAPSAPLPPPAEKE